MDAKATTLNMARLDVLSDKIDQQMCQLMHTELLKKFSNDSEAEGKENNVIIVIILKLRICFVEITLPPALDDLKGQKSFVLQLADSMGFNISLDS